MRISIIGLGVMGRAAAERLVAAEHNVAAFDPAPKAAEIADRLGVALMSTIAEAARGGDIILLFLPGPAQIRDVVSGEGGICTAAAALLHKLS